MSETMDTGNEVTIEKPRKNWGWLLYKWFALAVLVCFSATIFLTVIYSILPVPVTPLMLIRCTEQMADKKRQVRIYKDWTSFSNISSHLPLAVVCAEDQQFIDHEGFDFEAIEKALKHNKRYRRKRGASTISQQTAKNVFLYPDRSWVRKGFEVYFTLLVESFWTKERIMEVYLNVIEFGDGIYGAEAASQYFFKKSAAKLKPSEAALLAAVLPNPIRYSAARPSGYVQRRQNWILNQMQQWDMKLEW